MAEIRNTWLQTCAHHDGGFLADLDFSDLDLMTQFGQSVLAAERKVVGRADLLND